MIDVVVFKWGRAYRTHHVNALYRGVTRHYAEPFRFTAITDDATDLDPGIRVLPLWEDHADVDNPQPHKPSCYRRLRLFAPEARELIGERIVCLDLDTVICGDLTPLWARQEAVIFYVGQWSPPTPRRRPIRAPEAPRRHFQPYSGSMFMLTAGARRQVWEKFDPVSSPMAAFNAGYRGSDQGWFGFVLGNDEATWSVEDGIYSWRYLGDKQKLPANARLVMFSGKVKPWDAMKTAWVREHYASGRTKTAAPAISERP